MKSYITVKLCFLSLLLLITANRTQAQVTYTDPARVLAWTTYQQKMKKTTTAQMELQGILAGEYIGLELQEKKLNSYLDSLNSYLSDNGDYLTIGAEAYGMFFEVTRLVTNLKNLLHLMSHSPENYVATALSEKRSQIIARVIASTTDLAIDINRIFSKNLKCTEQEKYKLISRIKPKINIINKDLRQAEKTIRYTNLAFLYNEVRGATYKYHKKTKHEIVETSLKDWKNNYRLNFK